MKKQGFVLAFLILIALPVFGQDEAEPLKASYDAQRVGENIYIVHGPMGFPSPANQGFMNNPAFVLTDDGVVVIDPGSSVQTGRMLLRKIQSVTDMPVVATFATHIHGDHWLGNQAIKDAYPDVKMYAHPMLIEKANAGEAESWVDLMMNLTAGAIRGTRAVMPDQTVNDGDIIRLGGTDFVIHHKGKAHTESDIGIVVYPGNVLFTGDLVFNGQLGRMDDGSFLGLIDTLDHLISLEPSIVVPGHGPTGDVSMMEKTRELHQRLYEIVEEKFEEGLSDFEIKPIAVEQLADFSDWGRFEDSIGRLVSLSYLEVEENNF